MVDLWLYRERGAETSSVLTREFKLSRRDLNEEAHEAVFCGATETPVDFGDGVPEVLRMAGAEYDKSGVPFLNAHGRWDATDVLGRSTSIRVEGRELIFRIRFSQATQKARDAWGLVKDGSIDSVSVGYSIKEYKRLRAGEVDGSGEGRVEGPAVIATKWRVRELSLVPIGADPNARKRAYEGARQEEVMRPKPLSGETREQFTLRAMADAALVAEIADETKRRSEVDAIWNAANPPAPKPATTVPTVPSAPAVPAPAPSAVPATRSLDEDLAVDLEGRKKLILSRCPMELRSYLDGLLLEQPMIEPGAAWKALLAERVRRMPGGGTPEPTRPGAPPQAIPAPTTTTPQPPHEERIDLGRLLREVRS